MLCCLGLHGWSGLNTVRCCWIRFIVDLRGENAVLRVGNLFYRLSVDREHIISICGEAISVHKEHMYVSN